MQSTRVRQHQRYGHHHRETRHRAPVRVVLTTAIGPARRDWWCLLGELASGVAETDAIETPPWCPTHRASARQPPWSPLCRRRHDGCPGGFMSAEPADWLLTKTERTNPRTGLDADHPTHEGLVRGQPLSGRWSTGLPTRPSSTSVPPTIPVSWFTWRRQRSRVACRVRVSQLRYSVSVQPRSPVSWKYTSGDPMLHIASAAWEASRLGLRSPAAAMASMIRV